MRWKNSVLSVLELPCEVLMDLPVVTITGCNRLQIENYKGILEYNEDKIRIKTKNGVLKIEGRQLMLNHLSSEDVLLTGTISSIEYLL
ncbi:MAG: sporulation protein YqfC [Clostridiales bacterium]|nr:sporulation protein YqfC [Clostridiales bacterium]